MRSRFVLHTQKEFEAVYRLGNSSGSKYVVLLYRKNRLDYSRISFLASKKVGNSVKRNRARRLMKEAFRLSGAVISPGYDIVVIARQPIIDAGVRDVMHSLMNALKNTRGVLV